MKERVIEMLLPLATLLPAQTSWIDKTSYPDPRAYAALAHDTARARLVLFGGTDAAQVFADTWECAANHWVRRTLPASPPARASHAMVYDAARGRVVLFGGSPAGSQYLADTWEFDGNTWVQRAPAASPPARTSHAMVYDAARGRVVLFGGNAGPTVLFADTWEWDGTLWTQRFPATSPSARYQHGMAYDTRRGRSVLFGGVVPTTYFGDTWEWDGSNWTKASPAASPSSRWEHTMAYDTVRGRVVAFGGVPFVDQRIWEFDGATWIPRVEALNPRPYANSASAATFDSSRGKVVLFGGRPSNGYSSESWEWDGSTWTDLAGPVVHIIRPRVADDSVRGVCVYVGGYVNGGASETWEWDGSEWKRRGPATSPPAGYCSLAFDTRRGRTVHVGANGPNPTWEWDGSQWLQMTSSATPVNRQQTALAYDPLRGRVVMFGGSPAPGIGYLADTWEWDGAQWLQAFPTTGPSARRNHALAFDGVRGRVVLFGGELSGTALGDFWEWDGVTWTQLNPSVLPSPRQQHEMAFDAARGRTVLFGGFNPTLFNAETWEWDGTSWTRRFPSASPVTDPIATPGLAYDSRRGRLVSFGARSTLPVANATWEDGPDRPARALSYGTGCAGAGGTPGLAPSGGSLPWLGFTFDARLSSLGSNAATNVPFLVLGDSRTAWGPIVLPLPLAASGMPGCTLYTNILATLPLTNVSGSAPFSLGIPNVPALAGQAVQAQGWVTSPGANSLGVVVSNACEWTLGEK